MHPDDFLLTYSSGASRLRELSPTHSEITQPEAPLQTVVTNYDLNKGSIARIEERRSVMSKGMEGHTVIRLQTGFIGDVFQLHITSNAMEVLLSRRDVFAHIITKN